MGAPIGNQNASKAYRWKNTIQKRLDELQAMERVADALITKAMDGDISAIKEIGDRIDGKARQQMDVSVTPHETALDELK